MEKTEVAAAPEAAAVRLLTADELLRLPTGLPPATLEGEQPG